MLTFRIAVLCAALLATPVLADSQSSNSSSNCSNGRCSRVETYSEERRGDRRGYQRIERWRERPAARERGRWYDQESGRWRQAPRRRGRDNDD